MQLLVNVGDCVFISVCCLVLQVALHICNEGGAWSDLWVSSGTGQRSRTDSSASGRSREDDTGGVWTLPHEDNQLCREGEGRLCLCQLLGRALSDQPQLWRQEALPTPDFSDPWGFSQQANRLLPLIKRQNNHLKDSSVLARIKPTGIINAEQLFELLACFNWRTNGHSKLPLVDLPSSLIRVTVMDSCAEQDFNVCSLYFLSNGFSPNFCSSIFILF